MRRALLVTLLCLAATAAPAAAQSGSGGPFGPDPNTILNPPPEDQGPPPSSDGPPPQQDPPPPDRKPRPKPKPKPRPYDRRLSNERTLSRWAYVLRPVVARRAPRSGARRVLRLRTLTGDRTPELVLALRERRLRSGARWVLVRLPMRPNNRTGWVPRSSLGRLRVVRTAFRINRKLLRATLYVRGRIAWRARIGVGEPQWPTPRGRFYVRERLIPRDTTGIYGVFAFGLSAYSPVLTDWPGGGVIGVHGTNQPGLIPGRISHGCIRVRNRAIRRLARRMPLGTPVRIV
jgi:hypothetical protein